MHYFVQVEGVPGVVNVGRGHDTVLRCTETGWCILRAVKIVFAYQRRNIIFPFVGDCPSPVTTSPRFFRETCGPDPSTDKNQDREVSGPWIKCSSLKVAGFKRAPNVVNVGHGNDTVLTVYRDWLGLGCAKRDCGRATRLASVHLER